MAKNPAASLIGAGLTMTGTSVGKVLSVTGPTKSRVKIPYTNASSARVENLVGLPDNGDVTFTLVWEATTYATLDTQFNLGTSVAFVYTINDSAGTDSNYAFSATIINLGKTAGGTEQAITTECTVAIDGAVTFTAET